MRNVRFELVMSEEEARQLDECARAAQSDRSKIIRHLVALAYRELKVAQAKRATTTTTAAPQMGG